MSDRAARCRVALAVALLSCPSLARADVADFIGRPIAAVRFTVEGRAVEDSALLAIVETRVGEPLSMRGVRESVAHLASLGRYENVVVHAESDAGRVSLAYALTPVHPIAAVEFEQLPGGVASAGRLRQDIEERYGPSPPPEIAPDIAQLVVEHLRARGYLRAQVIPRLESRHQPEDSLLRLQIAPGGRARIQSLTVDDSLGISRATLLERLDLQVGDPYEPEEISARVEAYLEDRRSAGHFEARVMLEARFEDDDRQVALSLVAADGPRIRVRFEGDPIPSGRLEELVPIAREHAADQDLLEDSTVRIEEYLRGLGYRDATAPHAVEEAGAERVITFTVRRGPLYRVAAVEIAGNVTVSLDDVRPQLRLRTGQPFVASVLDADVAAIQDMYRTRGFSGATVRAGSEPVGPPPASGEVGVLVRIFVTENVQTLVGSVRFEGGSTVPEADLQQAAALVPGRPFVLAQMAIARDLVEQYLHNLGYTRATVAAEPGFSNDATRANVTFSIREGPQILVDDVIIIGNRRTRTDTIRREVMLTPGAPLSTAALLDSQRRLAALGLFRRVRIMPLSRDDESTQDVLVSVDEAPATTIGYGGGIEAEQETLTEAGGTAGERLEFNPRAFFEIGRRNLFGKNRSISLFTRVSLRSDDQPLTPDGQGGEASRFGFVEYRILGTFREPRVFGSSADAFLSGTTEQQRRPSFNFARRAFSAEVARAITRSLALSATYQIQRTELFDERFTEDARLIDRLFPQIRLSSFSTSAVIDTRDDQLNPTRGHYASVNLQLAMRRIGSEVGFLRTFLTGQWFRGFSGARRVVLATSARLGLANGFPRTVRVTSDEGTPMLGPDGEPLVSVVEDLPASERFFAGGDTTVRGFALDQLGTLATLDEDDFPLGGNAVAILNAELRVPLFGAVGVVGFLDAGNVFARTSDFSLGEIRGAVGFGVRYASPVGPIRVDLGFKTDRRTLASGRREQLTALHISLGQAF